MQHFTREVVEGVIALDPMLESLPIRETEHDGPIRNVPSDRSADSDMSTIAETSVMHTDVIRFSRLDEYISELYKIGEGFQKQLGKKLVKTLISTSEAAGNTINANGRPLSWELILELIEAIPLRFASDGSMISEPMIALNPENAKRLHEIPPPPDLDQRLRAIEDRKREQYFAQKRSRRISG